MSKPLNEQQLERLAHLERCEAQGQSLSAYGQANGIPAQRLYHWRSTFKKQGHLPAKSTKKKSSWIPVVTANSITSNRCLIRFPNGMELEWDYGGSVTAVMELITGVNKS